MKEISLSIAEYFASPEFMRDFRDYNPGYCHKLFEPVMPSSLDEWQNRAAIIRNRIKMALGLWPDIPRTPLNEKVFDEIRFDGFSVYKVSFESMPGFFVTGNLYVPAGSGPFPAILNPHGHWNGGRLVKDICGNIPLRLANFALMGYVAFAYDMVGYNDCDQVPHAKKSSPEEELHCFGPMALQTVNSIRSVDFLESLSFVDKERIGCTGASGGATQTFILTAVDPRLKVSAPVNMVSGRMQGGCACENAPVLRVDTNNMEIAALFAPKPMMITGSTGDWTVDCPVNEYPYIKRIYALYGAQDNISLYYGDAPHNYNRDTRNAVYAFFAKTLPARVTEWTEKTIDLGDYSRFRLYPDRSDIGADYDKVAKTHKEMIENRAKSLSDAQRDAIFSEIFGFNDQKDDFKPVIVKKESDESCEIEYGIMENSSYLRCLPFVRLSFAGGGENYLLFAQDTLAGLRELANLPKDENGNIKPCRVMIARLYPIYEGLTGRPDADLNYYAAFNRTGDALRVWETALLLRAFVGQHCKVIAPGRAAYTTAAALHMLQDRRAAYEVSMNISDAPTINDFFVPGLKTAGGWEALV